MTTSFQTETDGLTQRIVEMATTIRTKIQSPIVEGVDYGVPFSTRQIVDGRELWAVILNFGALPNQTSKTLLIPQTVLDEWGAPGDHWIDTGATFAYDPTDDTVITLPHTTSIEYIHDKGNKSVQSSQISISLFNGEVFIVTESDRRYLRAIITIKYLKTTV